MRHSIRFLLLATVMVAVFISLFVMGLVFNHQLEKRLFDDRAAELRRVCGVLKDMLGQEDFVAYLNRRDVSALDRWATLIGNLGAYRVTLIDGEGRIIGDTLVPEDKLDEAADHATRPEILEAKASGHGQSVRRSSTIGSDYLYVANLVKNARGDDLVVRVGSPMKDLDEARLQIISKYALMAVLGLVISFILSFLGTRSLSRGIKELMAAAQDMAEGNLSRRLVRLPRNEMAKIGMALNRMASRLSRQFRKNEENQKHLLAVLENMDDGVMVVGDDGKISHFNPALVKIFGFSRAPEGYVSENLRQPELISAMTKAQKGQSVPPLLLHYVGPPEKFIEARLSPLVNEGQDKGVVTVFHDLTEHQKLYQMRRDFVANISHELRTPLTAIMGATETLESLAGDNDDIKILVGVLERHGRRLGELARDVMELARLDALKPEAIEKESRAVESLFQKSLQSVLEERHEDLNGPLAGRIKLSIIPPDLMISGDFKSLVTALKNLLDNAIFYGDPSTPIEISAKVEEGGAIDLSVKNQGSVIDPEERERLFERFYRSEKSRLRHTGGAGLGLAIVKHVAQIHNGRVTVESSQESGTVFSLKIPQ